MFPPHVWPVLGAVNVGLVAAVVELVPEVTGVLPDRGPELGCSQGTWPVSSRCARETRTGTLVCWLAPGRRSSSGFWPDNAPL